MKDHSALSKRDIWLALGFTAVAIGTRAYGLGQWDFLVDEYATIYYAEERMTTVKEPAYYAIVYVLFQLFGISETVARLPAMIFGVISIPVFYLTWRKVIGRYGAAIGAILILLSSWHLWFSQFSRFYSALFFFGSLSFYYYWRAITRDDLRSFLFSLLFSFVGLFFHFTIIIAPVACGAFSLLVLVRGKYLGANYSYRIAKISGAVYLLAGLSVLPFVWSKIGNWAHLAQQWGYGPPTLVLQIVKYVQLPICVAALFGVIQLIRKDLGKGLFVLVAIGTPVVVLVTLSAFVSMRPDYMFFVYPLVFVAAGYLCSDMSASMEKRRIAPHMLAIVLVTSLMPEFVSHYTGHASLDIRDTIAYIEKNSRPDDRILPFVSGYDHYSEKKHQIEQRLGNPYGGTITWLPELEAHAIRPGRLWIIVPAGREQLNWQFQQWLGENASLVWRRYQSRYDYTFKGYEIFLVR